MARKFNFDFMRFCLENGVPFHTSGYKQCRQNWIQITCPFCYAHPHLGWNIGQGYGNCYSCGFHSLKDILERLGYKLNKELIERYAGQVAAGEQVLRRKAEKCILPKHNLLPAKAHKVYLKGRGLSWKGLQRRNDIRFTDQMTAAEYTWRIIIPIYYKQQLVSFQARSINRTTSLRYRTCPANLEARSLKDCLYGYDDAIGDSCVVLEGVVDQWKLGAGSLCTFGIDYSTAQVRLLTKFKKVFVLFDSETQAQKQADRLAFELDLLGTQAEIITMDGADDPGSLTMKEGRQLMQDILY